MIQEAIADLTGYGLVTGLIEREDSIYAANRLLEILKLDELDPETEQKILEYMASEADNMFSRQEMTARLEGILSRICDYAYGRGLIEDNTVTCRDLFDAKVMSVLLERPSGVSRKFWEYYEADPKEATGYFYHFCIDSNFIRRYRIAGNVKWETSIPYGNLEISINLSRPEKDPRDIDAAELMGQASYPKCLLCRENVGYAGRLDHPARQNHRIIPITLHGSSWYFQYSPDACYNEHCIVFGGIHPPLRIGRGSFQRLFDFVRQFPHYFIGSDADLPDGGGPFPDHEHFQGGNHEFPIAKAPMETELFFKGCEEIRAGIVKWPVPVIRISGPDPAALSDLADHILETWRNYTDEDASISASADGGPHHTIIPIVRRRGDLYEMDLVLCSSTAAENAPGACDLHAGWHFFKDVGIGLIEVMGLAVLPGGLKPEMKSLKEAMLAGRKIGDDPGLARHAQWAERILEEHPQFAAENAEEILQSEIGQEFLRALEHAGAFGRDEAGKRAFLRFTEALNR